MAPGKEDQQNSQQHRRSSETGYQRPDKLLIPPTEIIKTIEQLIKDGETDIVTELIPKYLAKAFEIEKQAEAFNSNLELFAKQHQDEGFKEAASEMMKDDFFIKILAKKIAIRLVNRGFSLEENRTETLAYIRREANAFYFDTISEYAFYKDPLTRLWSREAVEKMLAINLKEGKTPIIGYIDLNQFKEVNDTLGHGIGDLVLQLFAEASKEIFEDEARKSDYFGRVSGDEFIAVFVTDGINSQEDRKNFSRKIETIFSDLRQRFRDKIEKKESLQRLVRDETIKEKTTQKSKGKTIYENPFSVGLYLADDIEELKNKSQDLADTIRHIKEVADKALYLAKENKLLEHLSIVFINQIAEVADLEL